MLWLTSEPRRFQGINNYCQPTPGSVGWHIQIGQIGTQSIMTDRSSLKTLKQKAGSLGLTPYASLYGDRRQRATWEKLLQSAGELAPLPKRPPDRAQINWKLAITLLVGAIALSFLSQSLRSKVFPIKVFPIKIKITIQIGTKL